MDLLFRATRRILVLAMVLLFMPRAAAGTEAMVNFHIPEGSSKRTLKQFARQSQLSIVFDARSVKDIQTREVVGTYSPKDALQRLLEGTPLVFKEDLETGAFAVTRPEEPVADQTKDSAELNPIEKTEMKPIQNKLLKSIFTVLSLGIVGSPVGLSAQEEEEEEVVYELSPFTVDANEDSGYMAQNTLSGTRLKSSLKDVASSIQVATKEFLEDVGATDSTELLIYLTNTETGGTTGNFSGVPVSAGRTETGSARAEPQNAQRVRGLFTADLTRNYFKTIIPFDSYNTTRVEVNRGSNAILFGLGSPAGIINSSLIDSSLGKDFGKLTVRLGEHGSHRTSLDINHVLIEDKLSVRVAGLYDKRNFKQDPAEENKQRYYITSKWKPFKNTTIKGFYEHGRVRANRPDTVGPIENVSMWLAHGKPLMDQARGRRDPTGIFLDLDGDGTLDEVPASLIDANDVRVIGIDPDGNLLNEGNLFVAGNGQVRGRPYPPLPGARVGLVVAPARFWTQGASVWEDPNSVRPTAPGFFGSIPRSYRAVGDALDEDGQIDNLNFVSVRNKDRFYANFNRQGFQDTSAFDFTNHLLSGGASFQNQNFQNINLSMEQLFLDGNLGYEIAYDHQDFNNDWYTPLQNNASAIYVDMNLMLPDGRDNPNVGRPFVNGRQEKRFYDISQNAWRATAFYVHDFTEKIDDGWGKWLGKYTFTGLYSERRERRDSHSSRLAWDDGDLLRVLGVPGNMTHFNAMLNPLFYVGPSLLGISSLDQANISAIGRDVQLWAPGLTAPITYWDPGVQPGSTNQPAKDDEINLRDGKVVTRDVLLSEGILNGAITKQTIKSKAFITQAQWLNGHIVGTVGWRDDEVDAVNITNAPRDSKNNDILSLLEEEGSRVESEVGEDRWSWGVVGHWPLGRSELPFGARFSVHYGESSNFQPLAGRVDFDNREIPSPSGETTEKGFSVSLFEDKLYLRVNWYDTKLRNKTSSARFETLTNNTVYQKAQFTFNRATENLDPELAKLNRAVGNALLAGATDGENARYNPEIIRNSAGEEIDLRFAINVGSSDTEDVAATGKEFELVYNPTRNWRIMINVAQQETVRTNLLPRTENELIPLREALYDSPVPGYEWIKISEIPGNGIADSNVVEFDPANQIFELNEGTFTLGDYLEGGPTFNLIAFRTAKASEGSVATEQREWRFNVVNNYMFTEGFLKGVSVGGAWRWQSRAAIGFPFITNEDGATVGDVANPYYSPLEGDIDLWTGYTKKIFDGAIRWRIQLNVRNLLSSESDIIPVQSQPDGSFSRVRFAPQREFFLTNSFDF